MDRAKLQRLKERFSMDGWGRKGANAELTRDCLSELFDILLEETPSTKERAALAPREGEK
jgi:hypothetical protein